MSGRTLIRGWPREYYRSVDPKGKCAICKNKENPYLAINYCCKKKHVTCGVCFSMYSWNEDTKAYDCPKCIYEAFNQTKNRPVTLLEERMFVASPEKGPNTFSFSAEAARRKALREGRDPDTVIERDHVEKPPRHPASLKVESNESDNEDSDGPTAGSIFAKKSSQVNSSSNSSSSSSRSSSSSSSKSEVIKSRSDASSKSDVVKSKSDISSKSVVNKSKSDVSSKSGVKKITYKGVEKEYVKVNVGEIDCDLCRCALCADCIWEVVTR